MTVLDLPTGLNIESQEFRLHGNTKQFVSPLNRSTQTVEMPGSRWEAVYNLSLGKRQDVAAVQAFLVKLGGGAGRFYGKDFSAQSLLGIGGGNPVVSGASQVGSSLTISGGPASTAGWLKAGDYFQVGSELKQVTDDVDTDGSGNATISFGPELRTSPTDGTTINITNPRCTMRLTNDQQVSWSTDVAGFHSISFSAVEVF